MITTDSKPSTGLNQIHIIQQRMDDTVHQLQNS